MSRDLDARKVGIAVECTVCGLRKKPIGRSAAGAMAASLCDRYCAGYLLDPPPGSLWPGESEADFGYRVSDDGTVQTERTTDGE